ncbi:MAG: hypothetical protein GX330_01270 [Bacteroidales bacterium]|nr:hypothetical protein [Bacteroidales bacterium]
MTKNNFRKSLASFALVASVIVLVFTTSCNKYDKISIVGKWECDIKELRGLDVDSCKEVLLFNSGVDYTYVQDFIERKPGKLDKWQVKGNFERKHNKLTFLNRVKDGTQPQAEITYKYELIKDETLTLYVKGEGYPDDKKIYKRIQ